MASAFTCPRCFFTTPLPTTARFCPRCGLADAPTAAADTAPMDITAGGRGYRVLDRIAVGSICALYRCRFKSGGQPVEGIFKIAREATTNDLVANEADILGRLHSADAAGRFMPFLPAIEQSFAFGGEDGAVARQVNILRMAPEIRSPDELYTLDDVRAQYPAGLDPRHMAWIWRRILTILSFTHAQDVVHTAVLPMHILVEPKEHKLLLIDWCCAVAGASRSPAPPTMLTGGYIVWYRREGGARAAPTPGLDIGLAARSMIEVIGGDPVEARFPASIEPALQRYFQRCIGGSPHRPDAGRLLEDFDKLIETLWGPRQFRVLEMPERTSTR